MARPTDQSNGDDLVGRVVLVEMLGGMSHVHFDVGPHRLLAAGGGYLLPCGGDLITVRARMARAHLFGADGRALR